MTTHQKSNSQSLAKSVGTLIATRRKSLGLTQGELAERVEIEQESMSRIETGRITPSLSRLFSLADALDCPIEALLRPASKRKQDQSLVMEKMLTELNEAERAFIIRLISDFSQLTHSRRKTK
ncbi:MAG: helix-turn-helix transcriptional regulator [Gallionella sp.]